MNIRNVNTITLKGKEIDDLQIEPITNESVFYKDKVVMMSALKNKFLIKDVSLNEMIITDKYYTIDDETDLYYNMNLKTKDVDAFYDKVLFIPHLIENLITHEETLFEYNGWIQYDVAGLTKIIISNNCIVANIEVKTDTEPEVFYNPSTYSYSHFVMSGKNWYHFTRIDD